MTTPVAGLAPHDRHPAPAWTWADAVPVVLASCGVLTQIAFPLTGGGTLPLTLAAVGFLAAAALAHAVVRYGLGAAATLLLVAGGGGLLAEVVGVHTGVPFGEYSYSGTLGWQPLGVPAVVPMAWVMMAWPALHVGRLLVTGALSRVLVGAFALTAWDVFLDPQMVDAGHWTWADPTPAPPGVEGIPLTNFAGWLLVSVVLVGLLDRLVPRLDPVPVVPLAVYLWTYFSSVLANAVFFGRPPVALVGGLVMALVAVPVAVRMVERARALLR